MLLQCITGHHHFITAGAVLSFSSAKLFIAVALLNLSLPRRCNTYLFDAIAKHKQVNAFALRVRAKPMHIKAKLNHCSL